MSTLTEQAIVGAGLLPLLEARRRGDLASVRALAAALGEADLLAVGALADRIRAEEAGDVVRVYANVRPEPSPSAVDVRREGTGDGAGMKFLRAVAVARVCGPRAAAVRVDWSEIGLELAQVALGFGASELVGPIANKRGLVIADDATKKVKGEGMVSLQSIKQREIAGLVERSGRKVELVGRLEPAEQNARSEPAERDGGRGAEMVEGA